MILSMENERPVHGSFLDRYPLVEELEIKIAPPDSRGLGRLMCRLTEHLSAGDDSEPLKLWYMRGHAAAYRVGLHAPRERHPVLRDRLDAWIAYAHPEFAAARLTHGGPGKVSILNRLPFALPKALASRLLEGFVASCRLSAGYLSTSPDKATGPWGRILFFTRSVQAAFDAIGLSEPARSAYAAFHRDWIVRFLVLRAGKSDDKAREILRILEERAAALGKVLNMWKATGEAADLLGDWLEQVVSACAQAQNEPALDPLPDPFAPEARSVVLLQFLHILAQGLDLQPLEEAVALSTLISGASPEGTAAAFVLTRPVLEPEPPSSPSESLEPVPASHGAVWMLLVEAGGGDRGRELLKHFQRQAGTAYSKSAEALEILRKHELGAQRIERAAALLAEVRASVRLDAGEPDPLPFLLWRFFLGSEAYLHYCSGNLALAEEVLLQAGAALEHAIDREECLAPCAPLNSDIPLQRARIARRRNDWQAVARELSLLADLESGRRPLHRRSGGLPIDYDLIARMCQLNTALSAADRAVIHQYVAPEHRILRLNRWIRGFYVPKGLLVLNQINRT